MPIGLFGGKYFTYLQFKARVKLDFYLLFERMKVILANDAKCYCSCRLLVRATASVHCTVNFLIEDKVYYHACRVCFKSLKTFIHNFLKLQNFIKLKSTHISVAIHH